MGLFDIFQNKPKLVSDSVKHTLIVFDWDSFKHQQDLRFIDDYDSPVLLFISRDSADPRWDVLESKYPCYKHILPPYERSFSHFFISVVIFEFFSKKIYKKVVIAASHNFYKGTITFLNEKKVMAELYEVDPTPDQLARRSARQNQRVPQYGSTRTENRFERKNDNRLDSRRDNRQDNQVDFRTETRDVSRQFNNSENRNDSRYDSKPNNFEDRNDSKNAKGVASQNGGSFRDNEGSPNSRFNPKRGRDEAIDVPSSVTKPNTRNNLNSNTQNSDTYSERKKYPDLGKDSNDNDRLGIRNDKKHFERNEVSPDTNLENLDDNQNFRRNSRIDNRVHSSENRTTGFNRNIGSEEGFGDSDERYIANQNASNFEQGITPELTFEDLNLMVNYFNRNFNILGIYLNAKLGTLIKQATNKNAYEIYGSKNAKPFIRTLLKNGCIEQVDNQTFRVLKQVEVSMFPLNQDGEPENYSTFPKKRPFNNRKYKPKGTI